MRDRAARAERLGDYFDLQLRFAAHLAARGGEALETVVLHCTNLHRRFGFGDPHKHGVAPGWADYAEGLAVRADAAARLAWTQAFFRQSPDETPPADQHPFGCFACEAPDAQGVVRIHFMNLDGDGVSPLHRSKIARRRGELAALTAFLRARYPAAASIRGISWLYHLDAYRRLFPPDYGASATPALRVRLCGTSSWGQFLAHDERIKSDLRDAFLQRFDSIDLAAPWRSFPLPALVAAAPLASFAAFYDVT
jgi:hypothetical protein